MLKINDVVVNMERFPDGTLNMKQSNLDDEAPGICCIEWYYESDLEMFALYCIVNDVRDKHPGMEIYLYMPFVPNARMDRVKGEEIFTLKHFCKFINDLNFTEVQIVDPHSNVTPALLDRVTIDKGNMQENIIHCMILSGFDLDKDLIFFPDYSAYKKYRPIIGGMDVNTGYAMKDRNGDTGIITSTEIRLNNPQMNISKDCKVMIVDDIISYGNTMYNSAVLLKDMGFGDIYAYATHVENNILKGKLKEILKRVYTTRSIYTADVDWIEVI